MEFPAVLGVFLINHAQPTNQKSLMSVIFPPVILGTLQKPFSQKNPHVRNFSARDSGAENGCTNFMGVAAQILWAPGIFFGSFCWKTPMPIKFLVLPC